MKTLKHILGVIYLFFVPKTELWPILIVSFIAIPTLMAPLHSGSLTEDIAHYISVPSNSENQNANLSSLTAKQIDKVSSYATTSMVSLRASSSSLDLGFLSTFQNFFSPKLFFHSFIENVAHNIKNKSVLLRDIRLKVLDFKMENKTITKSEKQQEQNKIIDMYASDIFKMQLFALMVIACFYYMTISFIIAIVTGFDKKHKIEKFLFNGELWSNLGTLGKSS